MAPDGRLAITGIGVISSIGIGREAFWEGLFASRSGIGPIGLFEPAGRGSCLAGEVRDFDPAAILGRQGLRLLDRTTRFALAASALALADAGLDAAGAAESVGVALGTIAGSASSRGDFCTQAMQDGIRGVNPALFPNTVVNSPASQVAIRFGTRAFSSTVAGGPTASLDAIEYGATMVRLGRAQAVLAGGADELSTWTYGAFDSLGQLARATAAVPERSAPFGQGRNGFVLGEGAALMVLEPLEAARARGVHVYGEYLGGAGGVDVRVAGRPPRSRAMARIVREALQQAATAPGEIDLVLAGGSGAVSGDRAEARALQTTLSRPGKPVRIAAVKAQLGEALGAAGALQVAAALGSLARQVVPATLNGGAIDPRCPVACARVAEPQRITRVLVSACGLTGESAALAVGAAA